MGEPRADSSIFAPSALGGRVALVTGGGTGLGLETSLELARCGARVLIAGRRPEVLEQACEQIAAVSGARAGEQDWIAADIREPGHARRIVAEVLERAGAVDILVNNAGGQFFSPAEKISAKGWRAVWRLNVGGMLSMSEATYELAMAGRGGSVINITLSPHNGMPGMVHSGAARASVEALTRELAGRWAGSGVSVSAVAVGQFDTPVMVKYPESVRRGMAGGVPLQRMGTVQEHAWLVALLASPLGAAFNGSTVTQDGARDNWYGPWPPPDIEDESGRVPVEARKAAA